MVVEIATDPKVETLRAQLPAVRSAGYFNTGTNGPLPTVAFEAAEAEMRRELEQGRIAAGTHEANRDRNRRLVALAASMFGADGEEIALTHSAGEGLNAALMGLTWNAGDEVITTTEEHPGLLLPLSLLAYRHGVVTRYVNPNHGVSDVVEAIERQITPRTRVIALSHVLWSTGAILPLSALSVLARAHALIVIVDGAQAAGHVPVNLHDLGVDAYAMAGQKWLCGPEATGLLYVRRDRFADIAPTYARYGQFDVSGFYLPAAGAMRYEIGEFYSPAIAAQEAVLRWLRDEVDLEWGYARIATLGAEFVDRLSDIDGVSIVTPREAMCGLVNFNIEGLCPPEITTELCTRGFIIRDVETKPCTVSARAAIGWWNTEEEVAGLAAAIADLAAAPRNRHG